jgi:hypothetical protein
MKHCAEDEIARELLAAASLRIVDERYVPVPRPRAAAS